MMGNLITDYLEESMDLVDTEVPDRSRFARTSDGKIDFDAYEGLRATTEYGPLVIEVQIIGARQRYGHLDLLVTPVAGNGERWIERKNLAIIDDPANEYVLSTSVEDESSQSVTVVDTLTTNDDTFTQSEVEDLLPPLEGDSEETLAAVRALLASTHVK